MTTFYCSKNHLPKQCSHIIIYDKQRPTLTLLLHTPAHVYTTLTKGKPEWDYRKNKTKQKITFWKTGNLTRKLKCKNINESPPHTHTHTHCTLVTRFHCSFSTSFSDSRVSTVPSVLSSCPHVSRVSFHFSGIHFNCFVPLCNAGSIPGLKRRNKPFLSPEESLVPWFSLNEWSLFF